MIAENNSLIELKNCSLSVYKEGIILWKVKDNVEINLESAIRIAENTIELANNKPFSIIVDVSNSFGSFEAKARNYLATDVKYNSLRIKSAAIVNSLPVRIILNFYQKMYLKKDNLKIVKDYKEAIKWVTT